MCWGGEIYRTHMDRSLESALVEYTVREKSIGMMNIGLGGALD